MRIKQNIVKSILIVTSVWLAYGCLDRYDPPTSTANVKYLVVEGFLNSIGQTEVQLTRTSILRDSTPFPRETGAQVTVEGDDGSVANLTEVGNGKYTNDFIPVILSRKYRLKIRTADQNIYQSDYVPVKESPPIDNIRTEVTGGDVQFYLSTHDDLDNTRYYLWRFVETWRYNSRYRSEFVYHNGDMLPVDDPWALFYCWKTVYSSQLLIGTTSKLSKDVIHDFPLQLLQVQDDRFQSRYSLLVQQYALTQDGYNYYDQIRKSTETNGSFFDPQPSQSESNIHCITNPRLPAIGFFGAGSVQTKRIFVTWDDLPTIARITGYEDCTSDTVLLADLPRFDSTKLVITNVNNHGPYLIGYEYADPICVDCRLRGGSNARPSFW